jgi:predicted phage tail protein
MKLILYGQLRDRYGESVEMEANNVFDALEGFTRQAPGFPRDLLVEVVGYDSEEKLRASTNAVEVHVVPAVHGGGGVAKFFNIIVGAVMVVVGIILLPTNPALGTMLIISGATMALSGVVMLFLKAPTLSKSNDPAASKYLGINQNTTAIGTPILLAWGRIAMGGHYLSLQSDANKMVFGVFPETTT